ncbi:MAG: HTH domain-containing protein, partial [Ligilactobacillus ruminis]|nr:HTH domain-containing protein [Ligilactobacillus ruminis]
METIEKVFNLLTETPEYVSGQQIANKLNISRTAVWKAVSSLKQRGFLIEG